ncbi:hypothetical protein CLOSYM_01526 [[Clostridium] symbiosum ATCC 14940]|uniref:Uncharacterized protein n=1 Tax=[Clostridium] symbiosum ATCC 14940 TaxID=411472 RepID=A0ABC9U019_CLOSY|nr:hypothetical protein CLOSYM_01526 [[Clostridium] symbiosum ATCC 14940]
MTDCFVRIGTSISLFVANYQYFILKLCDMTIELKGIGKFRLKSIQNIQIDNKNAYELF